MSGLRFIFTLVALLAVFIGGGLVVDHWNRVDTPLTTAPGIAQPEAPLSTPTPGVAEAAAPDDAASASAETRIRKEFDAQAADAVAEAEARSAAETQVTGTATQATTTRSLAPELVSLDAVRLSADSASVIAGQAPAGAEVTLLANGKVLGKATAEEPGAWTIVLDEPVAPGTYSLELSAVMPGGTPVVRKVGEETVDPPAAEVASAPSVSGETAIGKAPSETSSTEVEPTDETPKDLAAITIPAPAHEPTGVPPDLVGPPPATPDEVADAVADTEGVAVKAPSAAESTSKPVEMADSGDASLTDQAGDVADSVTTMFTDWLNATREQAEEAAKTFTLATAGYTAIAETLGVVTMSGRGPAKAKVQVLVGKDIIGSTEIAETGRWLIEVPRVLAAGPHTARAQILSVDGSLIAEQTTTFMGPIEVVAQGAAEASEPLPEETEVVLAAIDYESMGPKTGRVTIRGRAAAGAAIVVTADGNRIGSALADDEGAWLHTSDTWLEVGAHAIRAEHVSATGEVLGRAVSELVRLPSNDEIATSAAAAPEPPTTKVAATEARTAVAKPGKRSTKVNQRKRTKLAAKSAKKEKRASRKEASPTKDSGYHIVNVHKGKELTRVRVRMPGRKGKIMSFMVPKGPGWVRARQGDSLWRIAGKWYGSGRSYPVIAGFNNERVLDPDRIRTRQRLRVP